MDEYILARSLALNADTAEIYAVLQQMKREGVADLRGRYAQMYYKLEEMFPDGAVDGRIEGAMGLLKVMLAHFGGIQIEGKLTDIQMLANYTIMELAKACSTEFS
jgi:hypothetical protein